METESSKKSLNTVLGNWLRYGVFASLSIAIIGVLIFTIQHQGQTVPYDTFVQEDFNFIQFFSGLFKGDSNAIMALGIMLLVLTPVTQLIFSCFGFRKENDRLYTFIALIVLFIIIVSTFLGAAS